MNKVIDVILENINKFDYFSKVYIFGSSFTNNKYSNDIDLLLIYKIYSKEIFDEKSSICSFLEKFFNLPIDITLLSEKELEQTKFLEKLESKYERLK